MEQRQGDPSSLKILQKDWKRVKKRLGSKIPSGHREWLGRCDGRGRPIIRVNLKDGSQRIVDARRVLLWKKTGEYPKKAHCSCKERGCMGVKHLSSGTAKQRTSKKVAAEAKRRIAAGEGYTVVSRETGVSRPTLYKIARGELYPDLKPKGDISGARVKPLGEKLAKRARALKGTMTIHEIAQKLRCPYTTAWRAVNGESYSD